MALLSKKLPTNKQKDKDHHLDNNIQILTANPSADARLLCYLIISKYKNEKSQQLNFKKVHTSPLCNIARPNSHFININWMRDRPRRADLKCLLFEYISHHLYS